MGLRKIIKLYEKHSVSTFGEKGSGKDLLTGNVIARRRQPYISNTDYNCKRSLYIPIDFNKLDISGNTYRNFISGDLKTYYYPYPDNVDIYVADCGIYFPSQYCNELNRDYKNLPVFMALSRHLGSCAVHTNTQSLNRVWDKIREQSTVYINTRSCVVLGKLVIQRVRIYERYDTALSQIQPFRSHLPLFANREKREMALQEKIRYMNQHGDIKVRTLVYFNKTKYNTRIFKEMLENEEKNPTFGFDNIDDLLSMLAEDVKR